MSTEIYTADCDSDSYSSFLFASCFSLILRDSWIYFVYNLFWFFSRFSCY